jgi:hypothetical protein
MFLRPVKTYLVISPCTSDKEEYRLLVFERKVLGTIYGPKVVNGVYRSRNWIENSTSQNVFGVVKSNRLRYAGHMIRGAEDPLQRALYRER